MPSTASCKTASNLSAKTRRLNQMWIELPSFSASVRLVSNFIPFVKAILSFAHELPTTVQVQGNPNSTKFLLQWTMIAEMISSYLILEEYLWWNTISKLLNTPHVDFQCYGAHLHDLSKSKLRSPCKILFVHYPLRMFLRSNCAFQYATTPYLEYNSNSQIEFAIIR